MKILLVGSGAREHIMAQKLVLSPHCSGLFVYGGWINPGILALTEKSGGKYETGKLDDMEHLLAFATRVKPDLAVVGPDNPIADGAVDSLKTLGIACASPTKSVARLESSKGFTRNLLAKYGIAGNPQFRVFTRSEGMQEFAQEIGQIVVKADGLHGGKGVLVQGDHFDSPKEGLEAALQFIKTDGSVVIEEKLVGQEFSLMSFTDDLSIVDMPPIQDHKRAHEGDTGPNTGGMGSYSTGNLLPFLKAKDLEAAHAITVAVHKALKQECGEPFRGVMYGGFMAVKDGVRLIEYNARFGDPEAMNALTLLETDFVDLCQAIAHDNLRNIKIRFSENATVCKYVVPAGYPANPAKGESIHLGPLPTGVNAYLASVTAGKQEGTFISGSSRAIAFVAKAETLAKAEAIVQKAVENIQGPVTYRRDIGTAELVEKKVQMMQALRA